MQRILTKNLLAYNNNEITELPDNIFDNFVKLDRLDFDNNLITTLKHDLFSKLNNLTYLSFLNNKITELPDNIFDNLVKCAFINS
jgi:Leucine-rich repeat (LRR) protein